MAVTMQQVYERLNEWAPFATQMDLTTPVFWWGGRAVRLPGF